MKLSPCTMISTALLTPSARAFTGSGAARFAARALSVRHMSAAEPPMPHSDEKMPFYALGVSLANTVGKNNLDTLLEEKELDLVIEGFCKTLKGEGVDAMTVLNTFGPQLNQVLSSRQENIFDRTKKAGAEFIENFLDCNEEAVKTDSGLVYYCMKEGDGEQPTTANTVEVHYHGTLIDGKVFDSSVERGQTISFPLSNVIKGWQEGLAMMKEGGKATLVIPSDLAYGDAGTGDAIPGGATLKFEVELFKVN
mmetsp:Transcript_9080/g.13422  ORF Transcript_9080/g.13422 Transcript_9080/m.13422 type:complete len:252 (-) Transcript_9080:282-1037(-)